VIPLLIFVTAFLDVSSARSEEIIHYEAGSLRNALTAIAEEYMASTGVVVRTTFGPSGLMREKVETGDKVDLFASADMGNALKLREDGRAVAVAMFTRNALCAFAKPEVNLTTANFVEPILDRSVKLGTSTPTADPGGDYTWEMFHRIESARPRVFAVLDGKAQKIVGGATAADASNPNPIKSAFKRNQINVMIGYCSEADQERQDVPGIEAIRVPGELSVGPEYDLAITSFQKPAALSRHQGGVIFYDCSFKRRHFRLTALNCPSNRCLILSGSVGLCDGSRGGA
jgi:molybdate transport system substrate-binding protein